MLHTKKAENIGPQFTAFRIRIFIVIVQKYDEIVGNPIQC